jgi:hypothetical protein
MTRVVVSTVRLLEFLQGGGHFWVYMQYVHALRRLGCEVVLLDSFTWSTEIPDEERLERFRARVSRYGVADVAVVAAAREDDPAGAPRRCFGMSWDAVQELLAGADLLLNFNYHLDAALVSRARRSALVDIDPGLLQLWIGAGLIAPARHDVCFTTGETVGARASRVPDCGIRWTPIRPPVALELWPFAYEPGAEAFTAVSSWWGTRDYVGDASDFYDNTKRAAFFRFLELPRLTEQPLELALFLADGDGEDRGTLERHGWRVRHSQEVAGSPERYRAYVQRSRGEFGWAKASCARLQNAWVSDRSVCYLASGKPVIVQHTGPSAFLPDGEGMFRVHTPAEAARALDAVNADYERHCRAARCLAEEHFDANAVVRGMLEAAS